MQKESDISPVSSTHFYSNRKQVTMAKLCATDPCSTACFIGLVRREAAYLGAFCSTRTIWLRTQIALPQELARKNLKETLPFVLKLLLAQTTCGIALADFTQGTTGDFSPTKSARSAMHLIKPPPSSPTPCAKLLDLSKKRYADRGGYG